VIKNKDSSISTEEKKQLSKVDEKKSAEEIKEIADEARDVVKNAIEEVKEIFGYNEE
jgi:hypothetical protein